MDVTIIALTGLPSSGKGEFSIISKSYGYEEVIMGDIIRNEIVSRNLEVNRLNSNKIMIDLRNTFGKDVIAKRTLDIIITKIEDGHSRILIDGIRSMDEINLFKNKFPDLIIVAIHANPKIRYERSISRKRIDDAHSKLSFNKRDQIELSVGIGDVIALSDYLIMSPNTVQEAHVAFSEVLDEIKNKKVL